MIYILLDIGMPAASWLGVVTALVITILGFTIKKIIENMEHKVEELKDESKDVKLEMRKMDNKINTIEKQAEKSISDMNLNIIQKLDIIKEKIYDSRK